MNAAKSAISARKQVVLITLVKSENDEPEDVFFDVLKEHFIDTFGSEIMYELVDDNGERDYYRIYEYIENAITYDCSVEPQIVYNTGKAFGNFNKYPSLTL